MVHGNLQWIRKILPQVFVGNPTAGILSLRRVSRVLWAYWGACLALSLLIAVFPLLSGEVGIFFMGAVVLGGAVALSKIAALKKLSDAGRASLLAPLYFFSSADSKKVGWK